MGSSSRLVYSTSGDNSCSRCGKALPKCRCADKNTNANKSNNKNTVPADGIIRLSRETKGRKGKGVTLIHGLDLGEKDLKALAKKLKALCGSGGTIKEGVIEIQGDHRAILKETLEKDYSVKLAGG